MQFLAKMLHFLDIADLKYLVYDNGEFLNNCFYSDKTFGLILSQNFLLNFVHEIGHSSRIEHLPKQETMSNNFWKLISNKCYRGRVKMHFGVKPCFLNFPRRYMGFSGILWVDRF